MKTVAFFNNKGGVGKTTLIYHLAWMFRDLGRRVLVADLDPQANLTSMFLPERDLESLWDPDSSVSGSIMAPLRPMIRGLGDIGEAPIREIAPDLHLIPGDLELSNFEARLSDAWTKCGDGQEPAFRSTSAFHRILRNAAVNSRPDIVLLDVGPNFGAINRAALICADELVIPLAPDLFSIQGLRNLGPTLRTWRQEWGFRLSANPDPDLPLPSAQMNPLGYVIQQFGIRDSRPVSAYDRWTSRIPATFSEKVLGAPAVAAEGVAKDPHCLGLLKHYRSLMPMAMEARKPVFHLRAADGAIGAHLQGVRDCGRDFRVLAERILRELAMPLAST
jgi:chromosome partitioning protein